MSDTNHAAELSDAVRRGAVALQALQEIVATQDAEIRALRADRAAAAASASDVAAAGAIELDLSVGALAEGRRPGWSHSVTAPEGSAVVFDAEGDPVAVCPSLAMAAHVAALLKRGIESVERDSRYGA